MKDIKLSCLKNPEKFLWTTQALKYPQIKDIFYYINNLEYEDLPNYAYIRQKLEEIQ